ncbi:MAG TPA: SBBP repeat-containing protein, partial [Chloroflexia bacterium]|nr:SBBP repeat-containing protein [Chloroflexia bacterium]
MARRSSREGSRWSVSVGAGARRRRGTLAVIAALMVLLGSMGLQGGTWWNGSGSLAGLQGEEAVEAAFGKLPLSFEPNAGQADPAVRFTARAAGGTMYFTPSEVVLALGGGGDGERSSSRGPGLAAPEPGGGVEPAQQSQPSVLKVRFEAASSGAQVAGGEELPGKVNYFIGSDPSKWSAGLPTYSSIDYRELYQGVTLRYEGAGSGQLKGTYTLAPGADPNRIVWSYEGAHRVAADEGGNLQIMLGESSPGAITEQAPVAWQDIEGKRVKVGVAYDLRADGTIGFRTERYDAAYPLTIDPTLVYSTYLGGSGADISSGIAVDSGGNAYITGWTHSTNFPLANPLQPTHAGYYDAFVSKLSAAGSALVYSTYLGGSGGDTGQGIAVDSGGNAYVTGLTLSTNFPLANPLQPTYGSIGDAFVSKLSATGSALVYSTYLGGSSGDEGLGIAVDSGGNAYVTGSTQSPDFPLANPLQPTFCGGQWDAFVSKLSATGSALVYSTYLGGWSIDRGYGVAVDSGGSAYVTGFTSSPNFPLANPLQSALSGNYDAFVSKLSAAGSTLIYSTYLGGASGDAGLGIAVDSGGSAYVTGFTSS